MSTTKFPGCGLPVAELFEALTAFQADERAIDKRILCVNFRGADSVEITTGEIHGGLAGRGNRILRRRSEEGWKIVEHLMWIS